MSESIAGIDDAGRGPIIGPLVIAGVMIREEEKTKLANLGVKDSKMLTPESRTRLSSKIRAFTSMISVHEIQTDEIDDVVLHGEKLRKLNYLEAKVMAQVVKDLKPTKVYVDASDVNETRYGENIREFLPEELKNVKIISEHHADRTYPIVSAASIIAKVTRDSAIASLHVQYGDFGSGYITDPKTIGFLKSWRRTHTEFPPIVRLSWKTVKQIESEVAQSRLGP
ncbi:MAG TPA: ribonuclease HII [Candidatus Bathyarchaeia archaeon]|nr:ribonuclease HII [Candidatus Bathyarchaeia archaeon]